MMHEIDAIEASKEDTGSPLRSFSEMMSSYGDHDALLRNVEGDEPEALSIFTSNILFLTGSLLFLWIALWNGMENAEENTGNSSAIIEDDDDLPLNILAWDGYQMLSAAAPFCFLLDAVVDMRYAFQLVRQDHAPSRFGEDPRWEIGTSLLFGAAATCDFFAAVVVRDEDTLTNYVPSSLAVHLYMLMAIFALWGRNVQGQTYAMRWYQSADILFLLGSVIDVTLSYFQMPGIDSELETILQRWSVVSATLWLVNSILYILADTCLFKIQRRELNARVLSRQAVLV